MRALPAALALILLAPGALAQDHAHDVGDGMAMVLHDGPADGRAVVGGYTHFGFVLVGPEGAPVVHRDANFTVEQDGRVLFTTEDAHEYDGILSFDVQFTRPGPYTVIAMSDKMVVGTFNGTAVRVEDARRTSVLLEVVGAPTSALFQGKLSVVDEADAIVPHTDLLVELRRKADERLASRFHLHIHDEPAEFAVAAPAGDYVLRAVGYEAFPTGSDGDIRPSVGEFDVRLGPIPVPAAPAIPQVPRVLRPAGSSAAADGYALHGMYDPQNQVGVGQPIRLAAAIVDDGGIPVAHVDFAFTLKGPGGVLFSSMSLHEYDGVFEHLLVPDAPGQYDALLTADTGDAELTVPYQFQVLPPAAPLSGAGVGTVTIDGLEDVIAGVPTELTFRVAGPQGPVQHSEVDVTIYHEDEAPAYQFKLHTHGSGETKATIVFPHAADWTVRVDPLPTLPQAVVFQGPRGQGQPITFATSVVAGMEDDAPDAAPQDVPRQTVPGAPLGLVALALALALVLSSRLPRRE